MLQVKTLGELRLVSEADLMGRHLRRKPLALLCYLARRAPRIVSRTELATLFWGERGEDRARQSLRQALTELKQALGDRIEVDVDTVRLAPETIELDIAVFEREVSAGQIEAAVGHWTGDFFEGGEDIGGDGFRRWIDGERTALHQLLGMALGKLVGDAELRGDWAAAGEWAERWAAALPLDERAHLRLIEVYRMSARHSAALKTHAAFVARVRTVLDVEPSGEFLRLGGGLAENARSEIAQQGRGSAAIRTPSLVGRSAVVRELGEAWTRAATKSGVVVVLRGEAGSGLSRLCDELAERVRNDGSDSVVMQTRGTGSNEDLSTAATLFDGLRNASGSAGAAPEALAEVARIVPALHTQFQHLPKPAGDDTSLRESLVQVLAAIGEEQPILLVVDDLHAVDSATRRLLAALAARLPRGVLLLLTEVEGESIQGDGIEDLANTRGSLRLRLGELTPGDVETMLGSMLSLEPRERHDLAVRLQAESGGLPHAIVALVAALVDDQLLRLDSGSTWLVSPALSNRPLPLPASMRARVRARFDRLSPKARAVAEGLAVLAEPSSLKVAAAVAELMPDEAEIAIGELVARRIIREDPTTAGQFVFPSSLLARTIAAQTPPTRREALHARAAAVLEEHNIGVTTERSLLSYHVARATHASTGEIRAVLSPRARWRDWRVISLAAAAVALVAVLFAAKGSSVSGLFTMKADPELAPIIALGRITDYRLNPGSDLTKPLADMLATNLGRVPRLRVVSSARMYELVSQQGKADTTAAGLYAAARRAGARELVEGALYARDDGGYRLDLRRIELSRGEIKKTYSFPGRTLFELADSGTAGLATDFGGESPAGSISDVTTRSLAAYRFYEAGLRAYYGNDLTTAEPLFTAAVKEDSTFAMAWYYAALSAVDLRVNLARFAMAARMSGRTSDRERLTILAHRAYLASDPSLLPLADTLVIRYPTEVEGYYFLGLGLSVDGRFLESLTPLNRAVSMDSLALSGDLARCQACAAMRQVIAAYQYSDSIPAAERETRRWLRLQPKSPLAWSALADVTNKLGRPAESIAALEQVAALDSGRREDVRLVTLAAHRLYAGDFEHADRLFAGEVESGSSIRAMEAYWYRGISYRYQGRLNDAMADARMERKISLARQVPNIVATRRALPPEVLLQAQVLLEMNRHREAAAVFDSISRWVVGDESASQNAHQFVWSKTHATGALLWVGDTLGVVARIDSIELIARQSGLKRDKLLPHYLRGLLWAARGKHDEAINELRQAIFSWNYGYTRINLALARSYMRLNRPMDAVAALQPALRGDIEGSNFYVSRTDVHEQLGLAWASVPGNAARDSAAVHMAYAARAWARADSSFTQRRERMLAGPSGGATTSATGKSP